MIRHTVREFLLKNPVLHKLFYGAGVNIISAFDLLRYGWIHPRTYVVSDAKKLVYCVVPKVACTSLKLVLGTNHVKLKTTAVHRSIITTYSLSAQQREYFAFAFVRNPFSRLVSCYVQKYESDRSKNASYLEFDYYLLGYLRNVTSFGQFVRKVCRITDRFANSHFQSQYSILYVNGTCIADYVGKLEHISSDYAKLKDKYDLSPLPQKNKAASLKQDWRDFYTLELIELVYRRYEDDIKTFGYESEYQALKKHVAARSS